MISKDIKLGGALCQCNIHVNMISKLSSAYSVALSGSANESQCFNCLPFSDEAFTLKHQSINGLTQTLQRRGQEYK